MSQGRALAPTLFAGTIVWMLLLSGVTNALHLPRWMLAGDYLLAPFVSAACLALAARHVRLSNVGSAPSKGLKRVVEPLSVLAPYYLFGLVLFSLGALSSQ